MARITSRNRKSKMFIPKTSNHKTTIKVTQSILVHLGPPTVLWPFLIPFARNFRSGDEFFAIPFAKPFAFASEFLHNA